MIRVRDRFQVQLIELEFIVKTNRVSLKRFSSVIFGPHLDGKLTKNAVNLIQKLSTKQKTNLRERKSGSFFEFVFFISKLSMPIF